MAFNNTHRKKTATRAHGNFGVFEGSISIGFWTLKTWSKYFVFSTLSLKAENIHEVVMPFVHPRSLPDIISCVSLLWTEFGLERLRAGGIRLGRAGFVYIDL